MFTFQQFVGFMIGITILMMGFWLMLFLVNFVFYWAFGGALDLLKERKAKREEAQQQSIE